MALLKRLAEAGRAPLDFVLDGRPCRAMQGDTVLTAVLTQGERLRRSEFSGNPRAGFCMMGACQDCWILTESGAKVRACSTLIEPGMRLLSEAPAAADAGAAAWPEDA